jgi:hypothetical protein
VLAVQVTVSQDHHAHASPAPERIENRKRRDQNFVVRMWRNDDETIDWRWVVTACGLAFLIRRLGRRAASQTQSTAQPDYGTCRYALCELWAMRDGWSDRSCDTGIFARDLRALAS